MTLVTELMGTDNADIDTVLQRGSFRKQHYSSSQIFVGRKEVILLKIIELLNTIVLDFLIARHNFNIMPNLLVRFQIHLISQQLVIQ